MTQFDVYINPSKSTKQAYPFSSRHPKPHPLRPSYKNRHPLGKAGIL